MTETTDRAALPLEVKHYFEANEYLGFNPAWGVDLVGRLAAALAEAEREVAERDATIQATINYIDNYMWHKMHESTVGVHCSGCEQQQELRDLLTGVATLSA